MTDLDLRISDLKCAVCGDPVTGRTYTEKNGVKVHFCGIEHFMENFGDQAGTLYLGLGYFE